MTDLTVHSAIIKLTIAYTLLGAFVFTVIITCLSLIGIVRFADRAQQRKLFMGLIVELVVICLGFFTDFLQFNPKQAQTEVRAPVVQALQVSEKSAAANNSRASEQPPLPAEVQAARIAATTPEQAQIDDFVGKLFSPSGGDRTHAYEQLTTTFRAKDYAAAAILKRGDAELSKPADQRDFVGIYHTIVTLNDMSRAVTQKSEFKDRIIDYARRAAEAFPRLETRASTLKRWVQSKRQ